MLIETLFDCGSAAEVYTKGYENATLLVTEAIDKIMTGEVPIEELVVSKILRKSVNQYRSVFPHVAAAIRLTSMGKSVSEGDNIQFLFTDADHVNPLCRVVAYEEAGPKVNIDREKYRELLLDAVETILSPSGSLGLRMVFQFTRSRGFRRSGMRGRGRDGWKQRRRHSGMSERHTVAQIRPGHFIGETPTGTWSR